MTCMERGELKRLRAENDWLLARLAEAQQTIRAQAGLPHVPAGALADQTRHTLAQVRWP